jgi:hypothetical protein
MNGITYDNNNDKEYKLPCKKCDGKTRHKVLRSVVLNEEEFEVSYCVEYEVISCSGCDEISFRKATSCSEDVEIDPETGEMSRNENVDLFPRRIAGRKELKESFLLPTEIRQIYKETHGALCSQYTILAGIGIRAMIEAVCKEKKATGNNLEKKIDDLVKIGVLTQQDAEVLHSTRLLGNISAHEITSPTEDELDVAMDVVEGLFRRIYIIPQKASRLPQRKTA